MTDAHVPREYAFMAYHGPKGEGFSAASAAEILEAGRPATPLQLLIAQRFVAEIPALAANTDYPQTTPIRLACPSVHIEIWRQWVDFKVILDDGIDREPFIGVLELALPILKDEARFELLDDRQTIRSLKLPDDRAEILETYARLRGRVLENQGPRVARPVAPPPAGAPSSAPSAAPPGVGGQAPGGTTAPPPPGAALPIPPASAPQPPPPAPEKTGVLGRLFGRKN